MFFSLFFFEMVIKIIGMGPKQYVRDYYNIFDALVVTLSIIDVTLSYAMNYSDGKGAISAFRAFRLIRIFKLVKSWTKLQQLLTTITKSLADISSFSVLLFLLMFVYVLLGMELFSIQIDPDKNNYQLIQRMNFNSFGMSFIIIFTILTGESWDQTMLAFAKQQGYIAIFFFISLMIIGVMIFLNLFLAILLENFEVDGENEAEE